MVQTSKCSKFPTSLPYLGKIEENKSSLKLMLWESSRKGLELDNITNEYVEKEHWETSALFEVQQHLPNEGKHKLSQ